LSNPPQARSTDRAAIREDPPEDTDSTGAARTLAVGEQFSVSRERIRQIEAKALRKPKHPSMSRILRSFIDN
jgi:hypothetical protein